MSADHLATDIHRKWFGQAINPVPIVLLHEGLGSISSWGPFPEQLANAAGRRVLAFDRPGYGLSGPHSPPWPATFMADEAGRLPVLLRDEGIEQFIFVGHSDGATIALLYPHHGEPAGGPAPLGIVSLSAHAYVENVCVEAITAIRAKYSQTLAGPLALHHRDADATFEGWSEVWISDRFRSWQIDEELADVRCPVLAMEGRNDRYTTGGQLDRIAAGITGPTEVIAIDGCDHWPHREATELVIERTVEFCNRLDPR